MKIALLFGLFPEEFYVEILNKSKGGIQYAADALQKSFVEGIGSQREDVEIINVPYIGSYPQRYSCLYAPKGDFQYKTANGHLVHGKTLQFCNLKGYKMYDSYRVAKNALLSWMRKNEKQDCVIMVYAIYVPFLRAVINVKKKFPSVRILLIVPDLPQYMTPENTVITKLLHRMKQLLLKGCYEYVDYYVLLSQYMVECLPVGSKPWTVIEGIFNNLHDDVQQKKEEIGIKVVFYSGTLAKRYGIMNLVRAFVGMKNAYYRLVICGDGDAKDEIESYARQDFRLIYKGLLPRHEILKLQKQADLLVNPRTPEGEFTRYSFPSKTMEYLASGVPTLLYRLPGIPSEYFDYCFVVNDLGVEALRDKMNEILNLPVGCLRSKGEKARKFILEQKNPIMQCKKIFQLIQNR